MADRTAGPYLESGDSCNNKPVYRHLDMFSGFGGRALVVWSIVLFLK
jgi:hypothetical protein